MGDDAPNLALTMAAALVNLQEQLRPLLEAVAGYKQALVEAGIGADTADQMSLEYHHVLFQAFVVSALRGVVT